MSVRGDVSRIKNDTFGFAKRVFRNAVAGRLKYGDKEDYNAGEYWKDRFQRHGFSMLAVGNEALTEAENREIYEGAACVFLDIMRKENIDFQNIRVLEIGCGTGFYTELLNQLGVKNYVGLDVTDVFFPQLTKKYPEYMFVKKDITSDKVDGEYDLVVMIDVIEHIVNKRKLGSAMENVKGCMANNCIFIISPIGDSRKCHLLFFMRYWSLEDIRRYFDGYELRELVPFRGTYLLQIRKRAS